MARPGIPAAMRREDRRARAATTLVFFVTGAVFAAWSTRLPAIKEALHLSNGALAAAILGLEAGAIAGLPAGGALVARAGGPTALRVGVGGSPPGAVGAGPAPGIPPPAPPLGPVGVAQTVARAA